MGLPVPKPENAERMAAMRRRERNAVWTKRLWNICGPQTGEVPAGHGMEKLEVERELGWAQKPECHRRTETSRSQEFRWKIT